jgi:hypothetical protein
MARTKRSKKGKRLEFFVVSVWVLLVVTVSLTSVMAKGSEHKKELIKSIRSNIDEYKHIFVFSFENLREGQFAAVRKDWKESR